MGPPRNKFTHHHHHMISTPHNMRGSDAVAGFPPHCTFSTRRSNDQLHALLALGPWQRVRVNTSPEFRSLSSAARDGFRLIILIGSMDPGLALRRRLGASSGARTGVHVGSKRLLGLDGTTPRWGLLAKSRNGCLCSTGSPGKPQYFTRLYDTLRKI